MEASPLLAGKHAAGLGSEGRLPMPPMEWAVPELLQDGLGTCQYSYVWHHQGDMWHSISYRVHSTYVSTEVLGRVGHQLSQDHTFSHTCGKHVSSKIL